MVKWLVKSERFRIFAYYTLVLGVLTIGVGVFERLTDHMIQGLITELLPYIETLG
jgi:undecaprenyl-diphosphatase